MSILFPERDESNQNFKVKIMIIIMIMIIITIKSIPSIYLNPKNKTISPAVNRAPVSRVTGGDTHHYTTEELDDYVLL